MDLILTSVSHCDVSRSWCKSCGCVNDSKRSDSDGCIGSVDGVEGVEGGATVHCCDNGRVRAMNPGVVFAESLVGRASSILLLSADGRSV